MRNRAEVKKEVLSLHELGLSFRTIAQKCNTQPSSMQNLLKTDWAIGDEPLLRYNLGLDKIEQSMKEILK